MTHRSAVPAVLAVAVALTLAACSSDSNTAVESTPIPTASTISSTPTPTPTPSETTTPEISATYDCGIGPDDSRQYESFSNYEQVWARAEEVGVPVTYCDTTINWGRSNPSDTDLEALRVAYGDSEKLTSLDTLYGLCATTGGYITDDSLNGGQAAEKRGALVICSDHPQKAEIEKAIDAGDAADAQAAADEQAKAEGRLIAGDGAFLVGSEIQPGTWTTTGEKLTDCYWELTDAQGNIIENKFISVSPQTTVTIGEDVAGFKTQGCGSWRMQ